MKKTIFILAFSLLFSLGFAQTQTPNTMPSTGNVGIGTNQPGSKLEVKGSTRLKGKLTADSAVIINGNTTVGGYLITKHIKSPDGVIHLGDSSMTFTTYTAVANPIKGGNYVMEFQSSSASNSAIGIGWGTNTSAASRSFAFGYNTKAYGDNSTALGNLAEVDADQSVAIGYNTKTGSSATYAFALGSGFASNPMVNNTSQSLAVGFNSTVPTFFVSGGNGTANSLGNVGIGTTTLNARLSLNGDAIFTNVTGTPTYAPYIKGSSNTTTAGAPDYTWYGDLTTGIFHPAASVVAFAEAGTEIMRVHSNGFVGIGITSPTIAKFSVNGDGMFTNVTGTPTYAPYIKGSSNVTTAGAPDYTWYGDLTTGIFHPAASVIAFAKAGSETMRIHSNGFVGIGQTNPVTANLEILNSAGGYTFRAGMGSTNPNIDIWQTSNTAAPGKRTSLLFSNGAVEFYDAIASASRLWINTDGKIGIGTQTPAAQLDVYTAGTTAFNLQNTTAGKSIFSVNTSNGNTHIGLTKPGNYTSARLTVDGTIVTKEIFVVDATGGWADYVFGKNYKLKTLPEIENYVQENKHLPNVPSAEEIKQTGQNISKLQVAQMEKIEELYLYIIEMNKNMTELNKKMEALQKENAELKEMIKN
ncbi:MAG TPA: hypothetical protein VNZ49_17610 [Bacteroidia bacterium]|jgi:hypothetical protein|nr:hypothetical protein [Bacteroidia bacterium]